MNYLKNYLWLAGRLLFSRRALFGGTAPLSLVGIILGVAALVVSMAVMSGFESTLQKSMIDVTGHLRIMRRGTLAEDWEALEAKIKKVEPNIESAARFIFLEAVAANQGQVLGVLIQGVDSQQLASVLNLTPRVIDGTLDLSFTDGDYGVAIGRGLARRLQLNVGDRFPVVVVLPDSLSSSDLRRKSGFLRVRGILDLGQHQWNERFVISDLSLARELSNIREKQLGLIVRFKDDQIAVDSTLKLSEALGFSYWLQNWRDANENLFEAVKIERPVIFFVLMVIILVAAFNAASTLFVNVFQRFNDIAILKSLGLSRQAILWIFSFQGLLLGLLGVGIGVGFGVSLAYGFAFMQEHFSFLPGSVYKVDAIQINFRALDIAAIVLTSMGICFVSSLIPARRGASLSPVEGLRHG